MGAFVWKSLGGLPWDWEEKQADFIKPGDNVLWLTPGMDLGGLPEGEAQVVLSRGPVWDFPAVWRLLAVGGFFLTEYTGGEDSRALANFLTPGSRPASTLNLENQLPLARKAGFRVMYRNQAYPTVRFLSIGELLRYIALEPGKFPGFSKEGSARQLKLLEERLKAQGFVENREHRIILILKKTG